VSAPGELPDAADLEAARELTNAQRDLRVDALATQLRALLAEVDEAKHATDVQAILRLVSRLLALLVGGSAA
jgi:hypothetical protein